ncbi:hypothetical protein ACFY9S_08505 [Streptomyces sp. NPDC012474]|uniref:hypothetical protein n=1 Tax=Streptomyces sp. NPDC012474 TaxID=3364836 RepID=UPI0036E86A56
MRSLPVYVASVEAEGDRDETLRELVTTDDPDLAEKPIVENFTTEALGTGLRSLRYTQTEEDRTIVAGVRYAWRSQEAGCDVVVIAAAPDPRRILGAMDDIDAFVEQITLTVSSG